MDQQEITQQFEIEKRVQEALSEKSTDFKQLIGTLITVIGIAVGAALWASNAHAEIKDWTAEQDFVTKKELTEIIKEQYVKKQDFVVVQTELKNLNEKHERLLNTLEKMDRKLDNLERGSTVTVRRRGR